MPLPPEFVEQLKAANRIEDVMGAHIQLKRTSRDYVCLCPFHSEKSPSCHIYTADQHYHCFGCGAGGDVITFVMQYENLPYMDAVRALAQRAGLTVPDSGVSEDSSRLRQRILEINRAAARFFNTTLTRDQKGEKGRMYFSSRRLLPQTITKYGLGYAPDEWQYLTDHLKEQGFTEQELEISNLARRNRSGGLYDTFRDRVMFPIINLRGEVIAFGGRIIDGEGPKYLNSSDSPVFKKSRNLFSLNFAKKTGEKRLILCEGYMDVISLNQAGFENTVATLGTALTAEQARLMKNYADEVLISYDSDGAGQAAAMRAINLLGEAGLRAKVLKIDGAKDPDEFIKSRGAAEFRHIMDKSEGAVNFELRRCEEGLDITSDTGRVEYLKRASEVIASIASSVEREVYISRVAADQNIPTEAVRTQVEGLRRRTEKGSKDRQWQQIRSFAKERSEDPQSIRDPGAFRAEKGIIAYLCRNPDELAYVLNNVSAEDFLTDLNRRIFSDYTALLSSSSQADIMSLQENYSPEEMGRVVSIITEYSELRLDRRSFDDFVKHLRTRRDRSSDKPAAQMSEDELLDLQKRLLASKKNGVGK
ncbi:MAG: DNA primase [Oscillospiraceae bacterium]|nr:DNA primase [Oscillospiraceae bacterium]